eukprot:CAMPEP_0115536932 /NCGR_PEP_ID=MMETSP0271-20121206/88046_1 /TAXON_ID=71861 /ORGANISM="Scrippsiella trochoidea, Strain CCMP3099" /LENGTH=173 /DNA_ID=CAMNT_0002969669 /DNA_START=215 /DNA_END=733 /DNA_ORIENTATION=-
MWGQPTRSSFFSDVYCSLADALQADTARLDELLELEVFPLAHRSVQSCPHAPTLSNAMGLCTGFCDSIPQAWQEPLISRFTQDLVLSRRAQVLAILRRCFLLGRDIAQSWEELGQAIVVPSETGQFRPLSTLQLRSFVDIDTELPRGIAENICAFAGIMVRSPVARERVARPA